MSEGPNPWFVLGMDFGTPERQVAPHLAAKLRVVRQMDNPRYDAADIRRAMQDAQTATREGDRRNWRVPAVAWPPDPPTDGVGLLRPPPVPLERATDPTERAAATEEARRLIREFVVKAARDCSGTKST